LENKGEPILARIIDPKLIPNNFKKVITIQAGDEILILDSAYGKPIRGPAKILTKNIMKKGYSILIYSRTNIHDFSIGFRHILHLSSVVISGKIKLGIRVLDKQPTQIKDRILSNFPNRKEITYSTAFEYIEIRVLDDLDVILDGLTSENYNDPAIKKETRKKVHEELRNIIEPIGFQVVEVNLVWDMKLENKILFDSDEIAINSPNRILESERLGEKKIRDAARKVYDKLTKDRKDDENIAAIDQSKRDLDYRLIQIENMKIIASAHGVDLENDSK